MVKIKLLSLLELFLRFFFFFWFFRHVSQAIMACFLCYEHLDTLLTERIFCVDLCAFVILNTLSTFLVQVVCKSLFFHDLASCF